MTARSFHEILSGLESKSARTFQPVRRNSYHRGEREVRVWRPLARTKQETRKIIAARLQAAERFDRERKLPGKRNGPLGHVALEVLRELYRFMDFKTGRVDPCLDTIMKRCRRSRGAIVAALARLRDRGFVNWIRRTEPTDNDGAGPQVRQISNAYGFDLPEAAARFVRRILGSSPPPDDDADRRRAGKEDFEGMFARQPLGEGAAARVSDPALAASLAAMGAALEARSASSPDGLNPNPSVSI